SLLSSFLLLPPRSASAHFPYTALFRSGLPVLRLEMQLRPVRADLTRHDRQELQMLFGVRGWRLPPDVEQADEVEPDDGECQVEAVRRSSGHLRGERIRVRRDRFAKVAEQPSERLADGLVP